MERWSEDELRRVASQTRVSERTLDACRDVLVEGMSGVAAAEKHKMFAAQISRALTTLRDKQTEMGNGVPVGKNSVNIDQYIATEVARALMGQEFECSVAQPGRTYEGTMLAQSKGYFVQKVGRTGVLHPIAAFEQVPAMHQPLTVAYDRDGGKAKVSVGQQQTPGLER